MATVPKVFSADHVEATKSVSVPNANLDGLTGTLVTVATGTASGTIGAYLLIGALGNVVDDFLDCYVKNGSISVPVAHIKVNALVNNAQNGPWTFTYYFPAIKGPTDGLKLESASYTFLVSTRNGNSYTVKFCGNDW
jgi:hypothetical protein